MPFPSFLMKFLKKWEGCNEVVPTISSGDLDVIGKIAQHAFLLFEVFPSQFSRAALKYYLFDKNVDKCCSSNFQKTSFETRFMTLW